MSGKWYLAGKGNKTVFPVDRGFDSSYGILGGAASFFAPAKCSKSTTSRTTLHGLAKEANSSIKINNGILKQQVLA
jgi:arylsulfatase A-like enzyme